MLRFPTSKVRAAATMIICLVCSYNVDLVSRGRQWYQFRGSALKMAADRGAVPLVQLLLDAGADPDIAGTCWTRGVVIHGRRGVIVSLSEAYCLMCGVCLIWT